MASASWKTFFSERWPTPPPLSASHRCKKPTTARRPGCASCLVGDRPARRRSGRPRPRSPWRAAPRASTPGRPGRAVTRVAAGPGTGGSGPAAGAPRGTRGAGRGTGPRRSGRRGRRARARGVAWSRGSRGGDSRRGGSSGRRGTAGGGGGRR